MSELKAEEQASLKTLAELTQLVVKKTGAVLTWQQVAIFANRHQHGGSSRRSSFRPIIPEFIQQRIFEPLGMKDTTFYLSKDQLPRLATSYRRTEAGQLQPATLIILAGQSPTSTDRVPLANGGLFSTAADYTRFCQLLLNGGSFQGKAVIKPETVRKFSAIHSGDLKTGFTPGNAWGIGCCVVREPQGVSPAPICGLVWTRRRLWGLRPGSIR